MSAPPHRDRAQQSTLQRILILTAEVSRAAEAAIDDTAMRDLVANTDILVICRLHTSGPLRPAELVEPTGLTRGGLSNLLDRLELRGLVTRRRGAVPGDRRGVVVTITRRGRDTATALGDAAVASLRDHRSRIDEIERLIDSLEPGPTPTTPRTTLDPVQLIEHLAETGASLSNALSLEHRESLHPARTAVVLACAVEEDGTRPSRIQEVTGAASSVVTGVIDELERRGLVTRQETTDLDDQRAVSVVATPTGRAELEARLLAFRATLDELRDAFRQVIDTAAVS